jgi:tetratricopeptide (TPR) repeat protein
MDSKLVSVLSHLQIIAAYKAEWTKVMDLLSQQLRFFEERGDSFGIVHSLSSLRVTYGQIGDWKKAVETEAQGLAILQDLPENAFLRARLTGYGPWHLIWSGQYSAAERRLREWMSFLQQTRSALGVVTGIAALIVGLQGKYGEAEAFFTESMKWYQQIQRAAARGSILGLYGKVLIRQGKLERAGEYLAESLALKQEIQENVGSLEVVTWLGELHEVKVRHISGAPTSAELEVAARYYSQSLDLREMGLCHYECAALTGLVRVKHAQAEYAAIPPLLAEAEQLAQQYEYNDHLASLRLSQGHLAWDEQLAEFGSGFDAALTYYQQALIYALRYNRFMLDEVLWGGGVGTPLRPIISHCGEHGEEGQRMLAALRAWWQSGANDIGTPRPDTISPIPEGIPLLEAERIAREREPGDGSRQRAVLDEIVQHLNGMEGA